MITPLQIQSDMSCVTNIGIKAIKLIMIPLQWWLIRSVVSYYLDSL